MEDLGAGAYPIRAPTCPFILNTVPLELAHHSSNDMTTDALSDCAPTVCQAGSGCFVQTNGKGPATQHKSEYRSCRDPGSKLAPGIHMPALVLSLLIYKMGVCDQVM